MPVRIIQSPSDAAHAKGREAQTDKHERENLDAQVRAADAAEDQVPIAWLATIFSALGLGFILWSLSEARAANKIARSALEQSERFAKTELRAYVYAIGPEIQQITRAQGDEVIVDGFEFALPYENFGATPAHKVRAMTNIFCYPMNEDRPFPPVKWEFYNELMLGPGEKKKTGAIFIPLTTMMRCFHLETEINIRVHFEYRDVLEPEKVRATVYLFRFDPDEDPSRPKSRLSTYTFGPENWAT